MKYTIMLLFFNVKSQLIQKYDRFIFGELKNSGYHQKHKTLIFICCIDAKTENNYIKVFYYSLVSLQPSL